MPKLVITITEVMKEVPGHPDSFLKGFERSIEGFYDDCPPEQSLLHKLWPLLDEAISVVFQATLGCPIHSGDGPLEASVDEAVAKAVAQDSFPDLLP